MKKSKKKFVLAGLVLLAITMVLLPLSGCKNDTVPPEVEKQEQEDGGGSETDKNDTVPETPKNLVTFDVGGNREAKAPKPITVESGTELTAEQVPELSDTSSYQFMGWYLGDTEIKAGYTVTEPVTVTARWQGWLTFTAEGEQSLIIEETGDMQIPDSMEYSTDGGKIWYKPEVGTPISFGNGTKLYLRAKSSIGTGEFPGEHLVFQFETEVKVACSGDIRTLVDYTNPTGADTANARFCYLFATCSQLTQAPKLPAEILADHCYYEMFAGCTSLTQAPELPAKALADHCYYDMFARCIRLTQAPELLAENLADSCYYGMFSGCTSLTEAPELPAKALADNCYEGMFYGCTSLTEAPELPAETLANFCYADMFYGCENLNSVTMLATDVSASDALYQWLPDTPREGTLYVANEEMTTDPTIFGSVPSPLKYWKIAVATTN